MFFHAHTYCGFLHITTVHIVVHPHTHTKEKNPFKGRSAMCCNAGITPLYHAVDVLGGADSLLLLKLAKMVHGVVKKKLILNSMFNVQ